MNKKLRMLAQEIKIHFYGMLAEYYKCKTLKHQYYVDKTNEYNDKIFETEIEFQKLMVSKEP